MNIYKVSQDVNNGYDTYDGFIVVAKDEEIARHTSPSGYYIWKNDTWNFLYHDGDFKPKYHSGWCLPSDVLVEFIGKADGSYTETTVILTSFNAG